MSDYIKLSEIQHLRTFLFINTFVFVCFTQIKKNKSIKFKKLKETYFCRVFSSIRFRCAYWHIVSLRVWRHPTAHGRTMDLRWEATWWSCSGGPFCTWSPSTPSTGVEHCSSVRAGSFPVSGYENIHSERNRQLSNSGNYKPASLGWYVHTKIKECGCCFCFSSEILSLMPESKNIQVGDPLIFVSVVCPNWSVVMF